MCWVIANNIVVCTYNKRLVFKNKNENNCTVYKQFWT